jgi:hypothetical protein
MTPSILIGTTKDNKNDIETKDGLGINLNIPDSPNFDNEPAECKDIDEFTSQCTSGGRWREGRHGICSVFGQSRARAGGITRKARVIDIE